MFFQRRHTDDQQVYEKVLNITNHQEMQIKATKRYHFIPLERLFSKDKRILEWVAMPSSRGIFSTQGSNPGLPHCWQILYHLRHTDNSQMILSEQLIDSLMEMGFLNVFLVYQSMYKWSHLLFKKI